MAVNVLTLIIGIVIGIIFIGFIYYGVYWMGEKYDFVRHPFHKSKSPSPSSPSPIPQQQESINESPMISLSEWINSGDMCNEDDYISAGVVYFRVKDGRSLSLDENLQLVLTKLNLTDDSQKWYATFYKDPNDPIGNKEGTIYNIRYKKYICFKNNSLVTEKYLEPMELRCPSGDIATELICSGNALSDLNEKMWISENKNFLDSTLDKKEAIEFFISKNIL